MADMEWVAWVLAGAAVLLVVVGLLCWRGGRQEGRLLTLAEIGVPDRTLWMLSEADTIFGRCVGPRAGEALGLFGFSEDMAVRMQAWRAVYAGGPRRPPRRRWRARTIQQPGRGQ